MKWSEIKFEDHKWMKNCGSIDALLINVRWRMQRAKSMKEIFMTIFLPVQLVLWTLSRTKIHGVDVTGIIMMLFTVIFAFLINSINKKIFKLNLEYELIEKISTEKAKETTGKK